MTIYYYDITGKEFPDTPLPDWAKKRLDAKKHPRQSAFAYALFCQVSSHFLDVEPPVISFTQEGAPVLQKGHISFSHSGNFVAVALSQSAVGVDVEQMRKISPHLSRRLQDKIPDISCIKYACGSRCDEGERDFLLRFCLAEATGKMLGLGMEYVLCSDGVDCDSFYLDVFDKEGRQYLLLCAQREKLQGAPQFICCNSLFEL